MDDNARQTRASPSTTAKPRRVLPDDYVERYDPADGISLEEHQRQLELIEALDGKRPLPPDAETGLEIMAALDGCELREQRPFTAAELRAILDMTLDEFAAYMEARNG